MGQAGSQPAAVHLAHRRAHTLPHEPPRHAPKVLPSLTESPRLRITDNGNILQSGGTISGRRPGPPTRETREREPSRQPQGHVHMGVFRSRSAGAAGEPNDLRSRERDPLHRAHTNHDLRHNDNGNGNKRFGSEPDLRVEEEQHKPKINNKHFRKKYRAPAPPKNDPRDGSSPDSSERNTRVEPQKKLRLFKTRNETKKQNGHVEPKAQQYRSTEYKSLDLNDQAFERRYRSPYKDKDQHLKYPDAKDMMQTSSSLRREEHLLQTQKHDYRNNKPDRVSGCRAKTTKTNEPSEAWKTPLLNRNFRYSERFIKEEEISPLRREKSFDAMLMSSDRDSLSPKVSHDTKMKALGEQLKSNRLSPLASTSKPLRKSLPSLLIKNNEEKDEFQAELKKATNRIRNDLVSKVSNNVSENKTSQSEKAKPNPTKASAHSKVKDSSPTPSSNKTKDEIKPTTKTPISRRPLTRSNDIKPKITAQQNNIIVKRNAPVNHISKINGAMHDRGQASGKESTPEHSPTRKKESLNNQFAKEKPKPPSQKSSTTAAPSKQFYFGMIEPKQSEKKDNLKDFPGLGSPIIEEISNFHLIEKKLLGYHDEDEEFEKFNAKLKEDCKVKNISSESALSSDASEGEGSDGSLGIALRLRPTLPKKQPEVPRFSPAAAWRQLASLDAHLASETQPLAVETKVQGSPPAESSPRSEQSADKSGDSGISGDHANSDPRGDSPSRQHTDSHPEAWTPQQDLGDSSSDGAPGGTGDVVHVRPDGLVTYSARGQPFSLSLPRDQDKGKQIQQGFNSLQKLRKSVSGALGAALGSRRFDLEHEPMLQEPETNWFLTKSAPNSLSNPLLFPTSRKVSGEEDVIKEETPVGEDEEKEEFGSWRPGAGASSYMSWGGHVMYLPPAPTASRQPLSMPHLTPLDRPTRSKSSGELEVAARAARAARAGALAGEMRERERSASPAITRALPARVEPSISRKVDRGGRGKRFTFQSTVRQLERRRLAERLSKEADLKEQQRKTELEAMRRVEEEFQRKRAREKASIRQQLRLVSGANSMPPSTHHIKIRDEPDGSAYRESPAPERGTRDPREVRDGRVRHSNASSETSGRSKSTTPVRSVDREWRDDTRQYRDWARSGGLAHAHPPACARMPIATPAVYSANEMEAFTGSPRSDNYRLEFARGVARSPRTPRAPRLLAAPRSPSTSGSELSLRQPIKIRSAPTVAFEEVPLGSGGAAIPGLTRATSRQCVACASKTGTPASNESLHRPSTRDEPYNFQRPAAPPAPELPLAQLPISPPAAVRPQAPPETREMAAKPDSAIGEVLEDRDPNNLNSHVQIVWDDVIGEPEGARSPECAWRLSALCFQRARNWCYTLLAVLVAPPCALFLGCCFACLAFEQIWCSAPCVRCIKIYFASVRTMVQAVMAAFVVPAADAVGHLCRHIRVNFRRDAPEEKDLLII